MKKIYIIQVKDAYGSTKFINPEHISLIERLEVTMGYGPNKDKKENRYSIHILGVPHVITLDPEGWHQLSSMGLSINFSS